MSFEKLERNGEIAVLYSPGFGAGWFTWNAGHEGLLFDKELVQLVLDGKQDEAGQLAEAKYPGVYLGGSEDLAVYWMPKGQRFEIHEYDGYESVRIFGPNDGHVA